MEKKVVGVLFGGVSSEHAISCLSAASIIPNIPKESYELILVGITMDGKWLRYEGDVDQIAEDRWFEDSSCVPCSLSPDRSVHGFLQENADGTLQHLYVDIVFPILHGRNGEDGTVQGLLALSGIPFVGCDMLSSAVCMDKAVANLLMDQAGIRRAPWRYLTRPHLAEAEDFMRECEEALEYPIFVKPANAGSSIGVTKVHDRQEFRQAIDLAFQHDTKILAERTIVGQELECAVMGNGCELFASTVGEIAAGAEFYDYDDKYFNGVSTTYIPAHTSQETIEEIRTIAKQVYELLGCSGLARVDFLLESATGIPYLNELNTIPGFTSISMYPKLMEASGIPYPQLLDQLLQLALKR